MGNPITRAFGLRVREFRVSKGLSQEELAERCDLHRTFIGRVERGETNITLVSIHKVAKGLGISASALVGERKR
jgi:transcriptional regulator with XRE-family HTH domain